MKIMIDENEIGAKIMNAWKKNLFALSSEILQDCNEYVKIDKGTLKTSSTIHSRLKEGKLVWKTPYAKRQYWTIPKGKTPGTTWKWCETAKDKKMKRWNELATKGVRDNL